MTVREKQFVEAFLSNGFNALQAARSAGFSDPNANAYKIRRRPEVSAEIESRMEEYGLGATETLARISAIATADMADFLDVQEGYQQLNLNKAKEAHQLHQLKSFSFSRKSGLKIELHDKLAALDKIGRVHGMFTQKIEHDFTKLSDADLIALVKSGLAGIGEAGSDAELSED